MFIHLEDDMSIPLGDFVWRLRKEMRCKAKSDEILLLGLGMIVIDVKLSIYPLGSLLAPLMKLKI